MSTDLLVHNLSHSDIILSINNRNLSLPSRKVLAKPKFSQFRDLTEKVFQTISTRNSNLTLIKVNLYRREIFKNTSVYNSTLSDMTNEMISVGFDLKDDPLIFTNRSLLRFRGDDEKYLQSDSDQVDLNHDKDDGFVIDAIYFPLLSNVLFKWIKLIQSSNRFNSKQLIVLVSGRGTPADANTRMIDNSTKYVGLLMTHFIKLEYPLIEVQHIHSNTNLFRSVSIVICSLNFYYPLDSI
jgi:hypothetical protein